MLAITNASIAEDMTALRSATDMYQLLAINRTNHHMCAIPAKTENSASRISIFIRLRMRMQRLAGDDLKAVREYVLRMNRKRLWMSW